MDPVPPTWVVRTHEALWCGVFPHTPKAVACFHLHLPTVVEARNHLHRSSLPDWHTAVMLAALLLLGSA